MRWLKSRSAATALLLAALLICLAGCGPRNSPPNGPLELRLGYFPNLTHGQALVGIANGAFRDALGENVKLKTTVFNAGPSAIEALFAGEIDITYVGPSPTITGYLRSKGEALRVIAGGCSGGAVLVVREGSGIATPADIAGKKIATPQVGNTQDISMRWFVKSLGLETSEKGGSVTIVPTENPNIIQLFQRGDIDGAWVPEPWGARLVRQAGGKVLIDERELWPGGRFITANVVVRREFLEKHGEIVRRFLEAHVRLTDWINENQAEAKQIIGSEIKRLTGASLPQEVLDEAFSRLSFTFDPLKDSLLEYARRANRLGLLRESAEALDGLYELSPLSDVIGAKRPGREGI